MRVRPMTAHVPLCISVFALAMSEEALKQILIDISVNSRSRFAREQARSVVVEAKDTFSYQWP